MKTNSLQRFSDLTDNDAAMQCLSTGMVEAQCYSGVLRNVYDEIYLLDFEKDEARELYRGSDIFMPPSGTRSLTNLFAEAEKDLVHPDDTEAMLRFWHPMVRHEFEEHGQPFATLDLRRKGRNMQYRWVRITAFPIRQPGMDHSVYLVCVQDVDDLKRAASIVQENDLLQRQKLDNLRYKAVVDHTRTLVFEWRDNELNYISPRIGELLAGNYDGRIPFDVWREDNVLYTGDSVAFDTCLSRLALGIRSGEMTIRLRRRDGQFIWCKITYTYLADDDPGDRYIGTINDVDAATRTEQALRLRAELDPLTGAYNTQTFFEKVEAVLRDHPSDPYAIVRFDVAGFKAINEAFGLEEGNRLLRAIARLVRQRLNTESEAFARLNADVFAVCITGDMARILHFIHSLSRRLEHYSDTFRVKLFFGVCQVENRRTPAHVLCDWAYLAQKTIKGSDLANYAFYDDALRQRLHGESYITDQMYSALEQKQFKLYLQPKVEMSSGRIVGAESLVRWQHPQDGLILPGRFVPLFERNGFIVRMDEYVWDLTCQNLRMWIDKGYKPMPVSVNVSRLHFNDGTLTEKLVQLTDKYRLPRHLLELELTESAFFDNEKALIQNMYGLQAEGFIFSMDDFGTGYSSLSSLRDLPFNIVKLDRTFISNGTDNTRGQIVARNTIALAKDLNMKIVAEGVETLDHARFLLSCGCNCAQGFYYSQPLDEAAFEVLSFIQEKAFWVDPQLEEDARRMNLPLSDESPFYDF
ncbi:MAG: EAL domain-containing protein [Desulfovibrio sp.]|uniref:putative bifunctional diguanylate cyclase/phosphodiesterase n=1 Tax=Desulfovibrio sp. TaxID=885 RepID=UPI0039E255E5